MDKKTTYTLITIVLVAIAATLLFYFKTELPTNQTLEGNATVNNQKEMKTNVVNGNNNTVKSVEGDVNAGGDVSF